jgi:putative transcriptional regulator
MLEEILDTKLIEALEFLKPELESPLPPDLSEAGIEEPASSLERYILGIMEEIGFEIFRTAYAPFSAVSLPHSLAGKGWGEESERVKILTGISKYGKRMVKRARIISSLSQVTRTKSVFVVNGNVKRVQIDNTVLIRKEELERIRDPEEFTCVIEERAKS